MQHIEINDAAHCTINNLAASGLRNVPEGRAARTCAQCEQPTWRLTSACMHCGYDRWARYKLAAGSTGAAGALAAVIFHTLK